METYVYNIQKVAANMVGDVIVECRNQGYRLEAVVADEIVPIAKGNRFEIRQKKAKIMQVVASTVIVSKEFGEEQTEIPPDLKDLEQKIAEKYEPKKS